RVLLHCDVCCLVVFLMIRPPPSAPLSPYPTLFRSHEPGIEVPQVDGVDLGAVDSRLLECLATRRYDQVFEGQGVEPAELGVAAAHNGYSAIAHFYLLSCLGYISDATYVYLYVHPRTKLRDNPYLTK